MLGWHLFGLVFQDAIAWAAGLDLDRTPTPWFRRADEYGSRVWRLFGNNLAVVSWDCGNGWMTIMTLEPLTAITPDEFRVAAARFWSRLLEAMDDPDLNGGDDFL